MSLSPIAYCDSLRIGSVDFVSPDEIKVSLDIDAPDSVALNTGYPRPFPRVNSYVLIQVEEGYLVGQVEWITVEQSPYPKRKGMQDFGIIDLPYPLRKLSVNPLGCLKIKDTSKNALEFKRGVETYPTIGDPVILPTQDQLHAIVESGDKRRVKIGTSPLAGNASVYIDPDRLFGRHLAVLGNTGSGKSCSVAGLIHWSLNAAKEFLPQTRERPNARFIILDPNGEYGETFGDDARVFKINSNGKSHPLQIPLWFWNSAEWCAFTKASSKTQAPTLVQALRSVRDGQVTEAATPSYEMKRYLRTLVVAINIAKKTGIPWEGFPKSKDFFLTLQKWQKGLTPNDNFSPQEKKALSDLTEKMSELIDARTVKYANYDFTLPEINELIELASAAHIAFGGSDKDVLPIDADIPRPFTGQQFMQSVEANAELLNTSEYSTTMLMRIRTMLSDSKMKTVLCDNSGITLDEWLSEYIGNNEASNGTVTVIDLSLVPAEIAHIITAVIARMVLEALQRYREVNDGAILPTVLVMEEAHTFVKKYTDDPDSQNTAAACCKVFEKIAREGRKYGLGLVLSSQRPSELSPTVLSQCNSFLLHRISNDKDQELVKRLVPDNLQGLLRDLPSLPAQNAILLGWASELPVLVEMKYLPEAQRPKSDDPDFWDVWTLKKERKANWKEIADDWQEIDTEATK